jgi:hypothetical protein
MLPHSPKEDRHSERVNVHQGNDVMSKGNNSKPSKHFRLKRKETPLQRELRTKLPPPKHPRPRIIKRKYGWGSESLEKSCKQDSR